MLLKVASEHSAKTSAFLRGWQRIKELLDSGGVQLKSLNRKDRYGRVLVRVFTNSGDVSPQMISEGLAAPFGKPDRGRWCRS